MRIALLISLLLLCAGCPKVERSASQAFDNANEVIDHGEKKLWMEPEATPSPTAFDNRY